MLLRLLLASGSAALDSRIEGLLGSESVVVSRASDEADLWRRLTGEGIDLVVAGERLLGFPPSTQVHALRQLPDGPEVIVVRRREDPEERARLLADGVLAVLNIDLPDEILGATLRTLLDRRRESLNRRLHAEQRSQPCRLADFSSSSLAMSRLLELARRVVETDTSLVIVGETGVGKEWLARAIHEEGPRSRHPFIAINCAAVPEGLLESELFGHEKGAFTGSVRARRGYFELAHRGTLFLDEVADMPPHLQAKLLRILQDRTIQRLGAETSLAVDVRIMAATNRELDRAMADGSFRSDLYYRLSVVTLRVPPLRERREDIEPLALGYLRRFRDQFGRSLSSLGDDAVAALEAYDWPGNVRELINVMERAVLLSRGATLHADDLPEALVPGRMRAMTASSDGLVPEDVSTWLDRPLRELRLELTAELERRYLVAQLGRHGGRIADTARASGIEPRSLYDKMRRHGLRKEDFKPIRNEG
jgi:DNA-binding NtrC family response regulator